MNKPKFDPTQSFQLVGEESQTEKPKFDASQPFDVAEAQGQQVPQEQFTPAQSALMGGLKGLTLQSAPTIQSAGETAVSALKGDVKPTFEDLKKAYLDKLKANQGRYDQAQAQNPKSFIAGNIGGSLLLPVPGSVAGAAGMGAVAGLQNAQGSLLDKPVEQGIEAAKGAGIGALFGGIGRLLNPETAESAGQFANKQTLKALGGTPGQLKDLIKTGQGDNLAEAVRDSGALSPMQSNQGLLENLQAAKQEAGQDIGSLFDKFKERFIPGQNINNELADSLQKKFEYVPGLENPIQKVQEFVGSKVGDTTNLPELWKIRQGIDKATKFNRSPSAPVGAADVMQASRNALNDSIYSRLPEETPMIKDIFQKYSNLNKAEDISLGAASRDMARDTIGLKDIGLGNMYKLPGVVAGKVARTYGASTKAYTADKVANLLQSAPEKLGRFYQPLQQSMQRGTLPVTTYILNQTYPEFRKLQEDEE